VKIKTIISLWNIWFNMEICNWQLYNLSQEKTWLNQTDFTVPSTKCLCNLNLCKPNTCLNWTNLSVPKGFGLDMFYCICTFFYKTIFEDLKIICGVIYFKIDIYCPLYQRTGFHFEIDESLNWFKIKSASNM
jgi:hypothetical protein